ASVSAFLLLSSMFIQGQNLREDDSIPVTYNGNLLMYPWAGGLNNPQYSTIDFNNDGIKDLFIYDESSQRVMAFLNEGITDSLSYIFDPSYEKYFPRMHQWAILADYNNDGYPDLFTFNNSYIRAYRNDYSKVGYL